MNGWHLVWGLTTVATIAAASACSSSKGGSCSVACPSQNTTSAVISNSTCSQCIQTNCGSQASTAYGSGWQSGEFCSGTCQSYSNCIDACPCSSFDSCITTCVQQQSSDCTTAADAVEQCVESNCSSQCASAIGGTTSGSSSGGQASSSSGSSGGQTSSSSGSGIGTGTVMDGACDGIAGNSGCPTANLVGCCIVSTAEICFYSPMFTATTAMDGCSAESGTFQTSP